jgi:threonine dehydrogenase-like Zn-dependent dehydrogenase
MTGQDEHGVTFSAAGLSALVPVAPDPAPLGPREVVGRTVATLISTGTELAMYQGLSGPFPKAPGYAAAFRVTGVGREVTDLAVGDDAYCMGPHRSFQRCQREDLLPLPAGLAPAQAVFARLMGVSMSTLTTTTARPPAMVVVTGLGLVGHLGARIFDLCGYDVIACDPDERRRAIARQAGLKNVLAGLPVEDPAVRGQVALVLECSGHEAAVLDGCRVVRKRGEVALVGAPWQKRTDLTAHQILHAVFNNYVVLRSGWEWELPVQAADFRGGSILGNMAAALRWLADGRIAVDGLFTAVSPRSAQQAYQTLLNGQSDTLAIVFDWSAL